MKPSMFTLVPCKPCYRYIILFATGHTVTLRKEGYVAVHFLIVKMIK